MTTDHSAKTCASTCWYVAVGAGLLLAIILIAAAGWAFLWASLLGVLVFLVAGFVLPQLVCTGTTAKKPHKPSSFAADARPAAKPAPAPQAHPAPAAAKAPAPAATSPATAAPAAKAAEPASPSTNAPAPVAKTPVTKTPEAKAKAPAAKAATKPAKPADTAGGKKPKTLNAPRDGGADDLKLIKGVGPKLEQMLHGMGFYHYDQIAKWSAAEVAWVDENLQGFKGRATRDDWTGQAATLASGGTTEFSARASKDGVR